MIEVEQKPADLGESGWCAILPPRSARPPLEDDTQCDYLVVGAGVAGLSAARRLRQLEADADIAIVDAREVAQGPAGRNSGFMIDLPHALASGGYAGENSRDLRNIRMNRAAIAFAAEIAREFDLPVEAFDSCGKVNAAASAGGARHNRGYARHLDQLNEPYSMLDARQMQELCGTDYYRGGMLTPGTAVLQPAMYFRRLADALVERQGCRLYENSAIVSLQRHGDGWRVCTVRGSVVASRVILAVNGLIESFGFYRRRLLHINLYASMTRALDDAEIERLGGASRWGLTPSDPIGSTVRRIDGTGGTRIVIRNRCTYEANLCPPANRLDAVARDHDRTFAARFPMLKEVPMEYRWSGRLCLSRNDAWALGQLDDGLYSACCQNGLGLTRGTIAGIISAEMASDAVTQSLVPDYRDEPPPQKLFPEPFMTLGARGVIRFKEWRAGAEL